MRTSRIRVCSFSLAVFAVISGLLASSSFAQTDTAGLTARTIDIGHKITLHYVEKGKGVSVIFVHGSLSDGGYWSDQIGPFAEHYRPIAYSRQHNYPNVNPDEPGYSAVTDARISQRSSTHCTSARLSSSVILTAVSTPWSSPRRI